MIYIIKKIWFTLHYIGMYFIPFAWVYFPKIYWLYLIIILSCYFNHNKCIITEIEYYLFNETFLNKKNVYIVPKKHRYILYFNFIINLLFVFYL